MAPRDLHTIGRWVLLVPGAVIGALLAFSWLPGMGGKHGSGAPGSSFATADGGAKAAYLMLERLGHKVERRVEPLGELGRTRLAFLMAPQARLNRIDGKAVRAWLEGGGTLVYGVSAFEPSGEGLRAALELPRFTALPFAPTEVSLGDRWAPARKLVVRLGFALDDDDLLDAGQKRTDVVLASRGPTPAVLSLSQGEGRIYLLDARAFSNGGLKEGDNALFLAALAARHAGGVPVVFDEFAHGYGDVVSVLGAVAWPLRLALGVSAVALLLYALAIGRRLGAISPDPAPPRRASIEQIEALAGFYAGKRAGEGRLTALLALAADTGNDPPLVPPANDKTFLEAAQQLRKLTKGAPWPKA